jgi:PucR C-terminal helix-turn-helix domain/GGDEF-like domain
MVHAADMSEAMLRARLGDAIPEMIDVVVARLGELAEASPPGLLDAIVSDPADADLVNGLAKEAGWPLPRKVAVIVLASPEPGRPELARTGNAPELPSGTLADWTRPEPVLVLPDPDGPGRAGAIDRALGGCRAAIGPAVPLADAARSLRWARQALALSRRGILGGDPVRCDEHLSTLLLLADTDLARALLRCQLAPLALLRPGQRERIAQTMLAWLELGQNAAEVAQHLYIHPQTVRYRLRQIQQLFGDRLRDPRCRFELVLALRARELLDG